MSMGDRMLAQPYERTVTCKDCFKVYKQRVEDQAVGFKQMDYDECPYCGFINGKSMSSEFFNFKMGDQ